MTTKSFLKSSDKPQDVLLKKQHRGFFYYLCAMEGNVGDEGKIIEKKDGGSVSYGLPGTGVLAYDAGGCSGI